MNKYKHKLFLDQICVAKIVWLHHILGKLPYDSISEQINTHFFNKQPDSFPFFDVVEILEFLDFDIAILFSLMAVNIKLSLEFSIKNKTEN